MKPCRQCGEEKDLTEFYKAAAMADGHLNICKVCQAASSKVRYEARKLDPVAVEKERVRRATPEYKAMQRAKSEEWRKAPENRDKVLERGRDFMREQQVRLRAELFKEYGSYCVCCGEDYQAFLTIEHTNNDGAAHRKRVGPNVLPDLKRRGWPKDEGLVIMCMNCNWARRGGKQCPHTNLNLVALVEAL